MSKLFDDDRPAERVRGAEVPLDFPDELRPHARAVFVILRDLARAHGAKEVTAMGLANAIMARPRKPLVKAAYDVRSWSAEHPNRRHKDVVAFYRRWLDKTDDLAAAESRWWQGVFPTPDTLPPGVTPIRRNPNTVPVGAFREAARQLTAERRGGAVE